MAAEKKRTSSMLAGGPVEVVLPAKKVTAASEQADTDRMQDAEAKAETFVSSVAIEFTELHDGWRGATASFPGVSGFGETKEACERDTRRVLLFAIQEMLRSGNEQVLKKIAG